MPFEFRRKCSAQVHHKHFMKHNTLFALQNLTATHFFSTASLRSTDTFLAPQTSTDTYFLPFTSFLRSTDAFLAPQTSTNTYFSSIHSFFEVYRHFFSSPDLNRHLFFFHSLLFLRSTNAFCHPSRFHFP